MWKINKPFAVLAGMLFLAIGLASCSDDSSDVADNSKDVTVTFTMSVGAPETVTRAGNVDWTDYDSIPGQGVENRIDLDRLQVFFYDSEGRYVSRVDHMTIHNIDSTTYSFIGTMRVDTLSLPDNHLFSGKVMVIANADASSLIGKNLGDTAVSGLQYNYTPGTELQSIPMWGIKTVSNIDLSPGQHSNLNDIWLLRALAKVNVNLTQDMLRRGYTLTDVKLNNYNTVGYVLPAGYRQVDNTRILNFDSGSALSFHPFKVSSISPPSEGSGEVSEVPISLLSRTLYLPEYDNSTTPTTISVTIKSPDGSLRSATFEFANYVNGDYSSSLNVVRNHAYVFNVYGNPIKIVLKVQPWTVFEHEGVIM